LRENYTGCIILGMREKIAFLGGSFNPPHMGHIFLAKAVKADFGMDRVLLITAKDPPHKQVAENVSPALRHEMVKRAVSDIEGLEASDIELSRPGKSYTADTILALKERYPNADIHCIVGADMLLDLPHWYAPDTLFREGRFIGVGRPGIKARLGDAVKNLRERFSAQICLADFQGPELSSTAIRERIKKGLPIEGLVTESVERIVYEEGLYQPQEIRDIMDVLRRSLKHSRFVHSMGVVRCAVHLAEKYGESGGKARLAALLHDCAKLDMEEQLQMAEDFCMDLSSYREISRAVLHGPLGAELAKRRFHIEDPEVLDAIRYHTVCRKCMTGLDKIIYLSDKIEWNRDYEGLSEIRKATETGLDEGVVACMEHSIRYVLEKEGKQLHPGILEAYVQLTKEKEEEK